MNKFLAILIARNKEFIRDRAALSWNFMFPVMLLIGFAFMFSGEGKGLYKIGIIQSTTNLKAKEFSTTEPALTTEPAPTTESALISDFEKIKYLEFVNYSNSKEAILKVDQHKIDLLIDFNQNQYWVNQTSSKGYIAEQLLLAKKPNMQRSETNGRAIRYVDWVMPGVLGMNMMFSCLFGVGYVIVRYRKNGVLKRFQATPLTAFEFLSAQVVSRLLIVMTVTSLLFLGCNYLLDFYVIGSLFDLFIVALLGACSMIALSLMIASKSNSEEFTGGLLNFASWPMMMLSGVWFSLEGADPWLQKFAQIFPLTHILEASRAILTDGASLADVSSNLMVLASMSIVFLLLGSWMFNWGSERT